LIGKPVHNGLFYPHFLLLQDGACSNDGFDMPLLKVKRRAWRRKGGEEGG
jgi:hypothetical protein